MKIASLGIILLFALTLTAGCAHVKMVSWEGNKYKFCTNPGNMIAGQEDFDKAAAKQCAGAYQRVAGGYESSGDSSVSRSMGGGLQVRDQKQMCMVYECK